MMGTENRHEVIILTGPTGSGKSALAMQWAMERGGVILNADAMQMYADVRILTARPSMEDEARVPHRLYGIWQAAEVGSVTRWLEVVIHEIRRCWSEGKLPILVGGTGMYIKVLMEGISPIPDIPSDIRQEVRAMPHTSLHPTLAAVDAAMAARLKPGDTQRLARALEVIRTTGRSLADWQKEPRTPPLPEAQFNLYIHTLPRETLYERINQRVHIMVEEGAIEEVEALLRLGLPPAMPLSQAVGVPEFTAYLQNIIPLEEAITRTQQHSRNYAKRQETWMRNQFGKRIS